MNSRQLTFLGFCAAAFAMGMAALLFIAPSSFDHSSWQSPRSARAAGHAVDAAVSQPFAGQSGRYFDRISRLRDATIVSGIISYQAVIEAAYPEGAVTHDLLRRKAIYRFRMRNRCIWRADYREAQRSSTVRVGKTVQDPDTGGRYYGLYSRSENEIVITDFRSEHALLHEAGHALQTHRLVSGLRSSAFSLGPFLALCRQTDASLHREIVRYLIIATPGHL